MEYWEAKLSSKVIIGYHRQHTKDEKLQAVLFTSSDEIGNIH
jgi:hypothetical protein